MLGPILSSWNLRKGPILRLIQFYVWSEYFFLGEPPKFQNLFMMSQSKRLVVPRKKSSELERHLQLINTDHLSNITKVKEKHTHTHTNMLSLRIFFCSWGRVKNWHSFTFCWLHTKWLLFVKSSRRSPIYKAKQHWWMCQWLFGFSTSIKEDILHKQNTSLSIFS